MKKMLLVFENADVELFNQLHERFRHTAENPKRYGREKFIMDMIKKVQE